MERKNAALEDLRNEPPGHEPHSHRGCTSPGRPRANTNRDTDGDANRDLNSYANRNTDRDLDGYANRNTDRDRNGHADCNARGHTDRNADRDAHGCADTGSRKRVRVPTPSDRAWRQSGSSDEYGT